MPQFDRLHTREYAGRMDTDEKVGEIYQPYIDDILNNIAYTPKSVLDIGCGPGIVPMLLAKKLPEARIIGLDSSKYMVSYAKQKKRKEGLGLVDFEQGDGQALRFKDDSFDLVLCKGTLKMIPNKLLLLREIWRVLKPQRCAFVSDLRRDGKAEFEKVSDSMPDEERESVGRAIERSLNLNELKRLLDDSGLSTHSNIRLQGYRFIVKITKR